MTLRYLAEIKGMAKGLGPVGTKIGKSAGMLGMDVSSGTQALKPATKPSSEDDEETAEVSPEQAAAMEGPEVVEKLPEPEKMEYDKLGAPNKNKLVGHIVRWGSKEYVLDWDDEYEVYKVVDPETLRVKTRVRPDSISTVDYRSGKMREGLQEALSSIKAGKSVSSLIDKLLNG